MKYDAVHAALHNMTSTIDLNDLKRFRSGRPRAHLAAVIALGLLGGAVCCAVPYSRAEEPPSQPRGNGYYPYATPESLNWVPSTTPTPTPARKPSPLSETERDSAERFHVADPRSPAGPLESVPTHLGETLATSRPPHRSSPPRINPTYSGDAREWAERFPYNHSAEIGTAAAVPFAPLGNPAGDGAQTKRTSESAAPTPGEANEPLDLSPSYPRRLPFSQVRGAVVCESNFPFFELGDLLDEITSLQVDLTDYMGIPEAREKIILCLFRDEKTYVDFLAEVFPDAPRDRRALFVKVRGKPGTLLVQRTGDFEIDLRHEMTHAIIHAGIENVPIWLDEGLAKYFEPRPTERAHGNSYLKPIARNSMFGIVPNLERLEKLEHIGEMGPKEYRDSWAWVHFMIHYSPATHAMLAGYLQMLGTLPPDRDTPPTLSGYLKERLDSPRSAYGTHFRSWRR